MFMSYVVSDNVNGVTSKPVVPGGEDKRGRVDPAKTDVQNASREKKKSLDEEYIGIIIGALAALIILLFVVIVIIIIRQRRRKFNNNHQTLKSSIDPRHITLDLNDLQTNGPNGKFPHGNPYNTVATASDGESDAGGTYKLQSNLFVNPLDELQQRQLPELPVMNTGRGMVCTTGF